MASALRLAFFLLCLLHCSESVSLLKKKKLHHHKKSLHPKGLNTTDRLLEVSVGAEFDLFGQHSKTVCTLTLLELKTLVWADLGDAAAGGATGVAMQISADKKWIRKGTRDIDLKRLAAMEKAYYDYVTADNRKTFLVEICAVEKLVVEESVANKGFMYMPNVVKGFPKVYDVKVKGGCNSPNYVVKSAGKTDFQEDVTVPFISWADFRTLQNDWQWLDMHNLADNSLLIGVNTDENKIIFRIIDYNNPMAKLVEDQAKKAVINPYEFECVHQFFWGRYMMTDFHTELLTKELLWSNRPPRGDEKTMSKSEIEAAKVAELKLVTEIRNVRNIREKEMFLHDYLFRRSPDILRDGGSMVGWFEYTELDRTRKIFKAAVDTLDPLFENKGVVLIAGMERGGALFANTLGVALREKDIKTRGDRAKLLMVPKPTQDGLDDCNDIKRQHRINFKEAVQDRVIDLAKTFQTGQESTWPTIHILLAETWISGTETSALFKIAAFLIRKFKKLGLKKWDLAIIAERQQNQKYTSRFHEIYEDEYKNKLTKFTGVPLPVTKCEGTPFLSDDLIDVVNDATDELVTYLLSVPYIIGEDVAAQLSYESRDPVNIFKEKVGGDVLCYQYDNVLPTRGLLVRLVAGKIDLVDPADELRTCIPPIVLEKKKTVQVIVDDVDAEPEANLFGGLKLFD